MPEPTLVDWIALTLLPGLGPLSQQRALERFGDPGRVAFHVPVAELARLPRVGRDRVEGIADARRGLRRRAEKLLARCERLGIRVVPRDDAGYPTVLGEIPDPPSVLYVRGELPAEARRVAVVGSRSPTPYGRRLAAGLGGQLAERGVEVVSGGALGIDSLAHRGALEAEGRTVAVLGSGLARLYPEENRELFETISGAGALVSEFEPDEGPMATNFPRRNRLISGLAAGVVVVEAAGKSGALITASYALDQGREVMAIPGPVASGRSVGCHRLLQQGAKLVETVEDILTELPPEYRRGALASSCLGPVAQGGPDLDGLPSDERAVAALLDEFEPLHLDELADRGLFGIARLQAALFGLELRGAVEQLPGRYYVLRPPAGPPRGSR